MATAPRVTIDPSSYPHIMRAIIAASPPMALGILRQTCKAIKEECDKRLYAQVGTAEQYQPFRSAFATSMATGIRHSDSPSLASDVGVLDIGPTYDKATVKEAPYARLRTIRFVSASPLHLFPHDARPWRMVLFGFLARDTDIPLPPSVRRIVLNITQSVQLDRITVEQPELRLDCLTIGEPQPTPPKGIEFVVLFSKNLHTRRLACAMVSLMNLVWPIGLTMVGWPDGIWHYMPRFLHFVHPSRQEAMLAATRYISWEEFRASSPHFELETDPDYRLARHEAEAVARGDEATMQWLGL